jgi:acyl-CoA synthetase (AMP-forming)/AMP-acid ligase II
MNLMMLLEMAASGLGDRVAVGSRTSGLTYTELFDKAQAAARRYRNSGVEAAELCDESSHEVPIALFGSAWAGVPYVPLNYRLPPDDLLALAGRVGSAVAVTDDINLDRLASIDAVATVQQGTFLADPAGGHDTGAEPGDWNMDPDDIAVLLFTSGTTGTPKSAVLRQKHLVSYILGSVEFMGAGEDEATLVSVPPYHIAGVAAMLSSVYAGRRIVQLPRFDPHAWIDTIEAEGVTHAMVVPTMLTRIVDALDERGGDPLLGVQALSYGGGKMPRPVIERALELFPITNFVNAYGLTETSSTIALLGPDEHRIAQYSDAPTERARLASVGRPLPGVEVVIRDVEGIDLPAGEVGEIFVRGEQVAGEYRENGSLLDADGWFPTRDGGYLDADGFLFVQGRNDDVIIRGGENMSPGEIEDVAISHPNVRNAAAIGVPDREWGEKIVLVAVADGTNTDTVELEDLIRSRLRSSRVPAHIVFVDELPHNDTGKLLRRVLREDYAHLGDGPTG